MTVDDLKLIIGDQQIQIWQLRSDKNDLTATTNDLIGKNKELQEQLDKGTKRATKPTTAKS